MTAGRTFAEFFWASFWTTFTLGVILTVPFHCGCCLPLLVFPIAYGITDIKNHRRKPPRPRMPPGIGPVNRYSDMEPYAQMA